MISPLRRLSDKLFCSDPCRAKGRRFTASALRDREFNDDPYSPYWGEGEADPHKQAKGLTGGTLAALVISALVILVAARYWTAGSGANVALAKGGSGAKGAASPAGGGWGDWLNEQLSGAKPLQVKADFRRGLGDWTGDTRGWRIEGSTLRPGRLRLWKPTLAGRDYELKFDAAIEQRAVAWAYRASDLQNYYAAKIVLSQPGMPSGASLLRYGVVDGKLTSMAALPLPRPMERARNYSITVQARGAHFSTLVDGAQVDEWSDDRLRAGGVGFFSDAGEQSAIGGAEFRELRGWMDGWHAALLLAPAR